MENFPSEGQILDLSGFWRRFPGAILRWHLAQLRVAEPTLIAVNGDLDPARLLLEIGLCGGELFNEREESGRRLLHIYKGANLAAEELDVRGARCPLPVIEARRRLRRLSPHMMLRLITDCTAAAREIASWTHRNPQAALLGSWQERGSEQVFLLARQPARRLHHA